MSRGTADLFTKQMILCLFGNSSVFKETAETFLFSDLRLESLPTVIAVGGLRV